MCGATSFCHVLDFGSNEKRHGSKCLHSIRFGFGVFFGSWRNNTCIHGGVLFYIGYTPSLRVNDNDKKKRKKKNNENVNDNESLRGGRFSCF